MIGRITAKTLASTFTLASTSRMPLNANYLNYSFALLTNPNRVVSDVPQT